MKVMVEKSVFQDQWYIPLYIVIYSDLERNWLNRRSIKHYLWKHTFDECIKILNDLCCDRCYRGCYVDFKWFYHWNITGDLYLDNDIFNEKY